MNAKTATRRAEPHGDRRQARWPEATLALFLGLALLVHRQALVPLDEAAMSALASLRPADAPGTTEAFNLVFRLGYAPLDGLLAVLWSLVAYLRTRDLRLAALPLLLAAVVGAQTITRLVVVRPGPALAFAIQRAYAPAGVVRGLDQTDAALRGAFVATTGAGDANDQGRGSYPSGHAARAAFLGLLAAASLGPRLGRAAVHAGLGAVVLLVGYSTLYFGYHWPSDILGGYLLGAAVLGFGRRWLALLPLPGRPTH